MDLSDANTITTNENEKCACVLVMDPLNPSTCRHCHRPFACSHTDLDKTIAQQAAEIKQLKDQLRLKTEQWEQLQLDMQELNKKYVAGIQRVADIQHEKDLVEHDLEELSCKLFEEANGMVAEEKREKWQLENALRQTQEQLAAEQSQLKELRQRMQEMEMETKTTTIITEANLENDPQMRARMDFQELHGLKRASSTYASLARKEQQKQQQTYNSLQQQDQQQQQPQQQQRVASMPPLCSQPKPQRELTIDEIQLAAFNDFVISSRTVPLKKMHQFAYMKHCQTEDIEPCLRFGPHSRLSVKKMMDYLLRQPCFIEHATTDPHHQKPFSQPSGQVPSSAAFVQRPLWGRLSNHNGHKSFSGCAACGRPADQDHPLMYRFRLDEADDWSPIDQYCRDRLVAVCEFYVFIRNIQLGLYADRPVRDLYAENIRLRLQMFYSRMGALPVILDGIGVDLDAVGKASPPLDALATIPDDPYTSDGSVSSAGPRTPINYA
ncbi:rab guanine nucleotide exchange factor S2 [Apophysomyces ossiformis]|uniref:Rab guanine nucleotide exchange factor S2 n=1 Tax=Apophysomyces ossiformis TaxID=679940 RepID=A0A8H7EQN2_9FUNG|nr:rab guanine nucleotide exchange factor S2 [Apophysomyces ossiformis]